MARLHGGPNDGERHDLDLVGVRVLIPIGGTSEHGAHDLVYEYERPGEYRFWGRHYGWRTPEAHYYASTTKLRRSGASREAVWAEQ